MFILVRRSFIILMSCSGLSLKVFNHRDHFLIGMEFLLYWGIFTVYSWFCTHSSYKQKEWGLQFLLPPLPCVPNFYMSCTQNHHACQLGKLASLLLRPNSLCIAV